MDRFEYADPRPGQSEEFLMRETGVKLYDGDNKVINYDLLQYLFPLFDLTTMCFVPL